MTNTIEPLLCGDTFVTSSSGQSRTQSQRHMPTWSGSEIVYVPVVFR